MSMKPVKDLKVGDRVKLKQAISNEIVKSWKYANACDNVAGGIQANTVFTIVEAHATSFPRVKLQIPGRDPPGYLTVSGEELSWKFSLV